MQRKVKTAISRLDASLAISMREIENADFILVIGADPINEAPMLALAIRQAYRGGATVTVVDPRPVFLPMPFHHLPVAPQEIDLCLSVMVKGAVNRAAVEELGRLRFSFMMPFHQRDLFRPRSRNDWMSSFRNSSRANTW